MHRSELGEPAAVSSDVILRLLLPVASALVGPSRTSAVSAAMSAAKKARTALDEVDDKGNFKRTAAAWRTQAIEAGGKFEPEAGRYHLYVALGCPWAAGALTALHHKGLEDTISVSIAHPTWRRTRPEDPDDEHFGWWFRNPSDPPVSNELGYGENECDEALVPDTVNHCKNLREVYELAGDTAGKYSTPVLWCKKEKTIVSNESMDILKLFDSSFNALAKKPAVSLFPQAQASVLDDLNTWIYPSVNNGVYRAGFATKQSAYDEAVTELFQALDRLETRLAEGGGPFLTGTDFTWLDVRLYHTLVRFDPVYVTYFKTNLKRIQDCPALLAYMRACYAIPAVKRTTNIKHIKMHYFTSHCLKGYNNNGVIPAANGPALE